mmetsp:Transcript_29236/g.67805  ORF Transcript_29236/g.67805 Transcript_29236/m.67805 type:complete len:273 (-) Transcript_29236:2902-3720(-)
MNMNWKKLATGMARRATTRPQSEALRGSSKTLLPWACAASGMTDSINMKRQAMYLTRDMSAHGTEYKQRYRMWPLRTWSIFRRHQPCLDDVLALTFLRYSRGARASNRTSRLSKMWPTISHKAKKRSSAVRNTRDQTRSTRGGIRAEKCSDDGAVLISPTAGQAASATVARRKQAHSTRVSEADVTRHPRLDHTGSVESRSTPLHTAVVSSVPDTPTSSWNSSGCGVCRSTTGSPPGGATETVRASDTSAGPVGGSKESPPLRAVRTDQTST